MSRHQAVRNLDYEEVLDEYEGYDEGGDGGDGVSAEDRVALAEGTAEVQRLLGVEASKVTAEQIQEALWYYYYDVDKSVTYLTKKYIAPPATKPAKKSPEGYPLTRKPQLQASFFFLGTGWLNISMAHQAVMVGPTLPRGGLLGGGDPIPKMSKLQALAAARKKKTDDKKVDDKIGEAQKKVSRLSISDGSGKENLSSELNPASKRQKVVDKPTRSTSSQIQPIHLRHKLEPVDGNDDSSPTDIDESDTTTNRTFLAKSSGPSNKEHPVSAAAVPSAFARTLFGSGPIPNTSVSQTFSLPYTRSPAFHAEVFAKPSPDDIVLAAQAQAGKKASATAQKASSDGKKPVKSKDTPNGDVDTSTEGIKQLEIKAEDSESSQPDTAPKSKGLDVVREFESSKGKSKRSASFVVVGHVDAGKSTLMGRLLLELKFVDKQTIDRYRRQAEKIGKQSFALAWVMDQRSEERERGVTIDIATNQFETDRTRFTILDAPGHQDFVPNMIAGASQADFAILAIDANTGAFEKGLKGQTKEHALLLRSLGIQRVIVAVNKLDMVGWSQERFDEISQQVTGFLTTTGFQDKNISFIPISGLNGDNLVRRSENDAISWYKGSTLIEALEESEPLARVLQKPFRMAIAEVFRSPLGSITVSGRIDSGTVQIGDSLLVQPSGETAAVRSLEVDSDVQDWAVAGQNVSLALTGIDAIHVKVGDILCDTKAPIEVGDAFTMKVLAFEHLMPMPVDVHRGRLHAAGHIQSMQAVLDKATGKVTKKKPKVIAPANVARIVVKLSTKVPLEAGQRVVLRSGGETVGAGLLE